MAEKDTRTFIRVHDGMPDHPKIDGLSDAAFRLLVTMWCWSSRHRTDGRIPAGTWQKRGTAKSRAELVTARLAEVAEDGSVHMHDYTQHQRTAEEIKALEHARTISGALGNHTRWHVERGITDPNCDHCRDPKPVANAIATGSQPDRIDISRYRDKNTSPDGDADDVPPIDPRDDVERVCRHLVERMVGNGYQRPAITNRWRESARLMLDRDGRTEEQIIRAIDWAHDSTFWRSNIKSIPKLRAQYDTLRLQAQRERSTEPTRAEVATLHGVPEAWV